MWNGQFVFVYVAARCKNPRGGKPLGAGSKAAECCEIHTGEAWDRARCSLGGKKKMYNHKVQHNSHRAQQCKGPLPTSQSQYWSCPLPQPWISSFHLPSKLIFSAFAIHPLWEDFTARKGNSWGFVKDKDLQSSQHHTAAVGSPSEEQTTSTDMSPFFPATLASERLFSLILAQEKKNHGLIFRQNMQDSCFSHKSNSRPLSNWK